MTQRTKRSFVVYLEKSLGIDDVYDQYKIETKVPGVRKYKYTRVQFKKIMYALHKNIADKMIERSWIIRLPYNLGSLGVYSVKMRFPTDERERNSLFAVDFKYFKETGKRIRYMNHHSDNFRVRFKWIKSFIEKGYSFYSFRAAKCNKKRISDYAKEKDGYKRYLAK